MGRGGEVGLSEEEGEETEFQMSDGKDKEGVLEWVRRHRDAFGVATVQRESQAPQMAGTAAEAKDGGGTGAGGDSYSDSDFEVSSMSSDGSSPTSGSNSGSGSDAGLGEGEDDGSEDGSQGRENDGDDEDVVELDPKHHLLS